MGMHHLAFVCLFVASCSARVLTTNDCDCVANPKDMCCMGWTYPDSSSRNDIKTICDASPQLFACGLARRVCGTRTTGFCTPFSLLADLCTDSDHPTTGCETYSALCVEGTMVSQCESSGPMDHVLTTAAATSALIGLCRDMSMMSQCTESCSTPAGASCNCKDIAPGTCAINTSTSSLVDAVSSICNDMAMTDCDGFFDMCAAAASNEFVPFCPKQVSPPSPFCSGHGTAMYMNGFTATLLPTDACPVFLFQTWVLRTKGWVAFGVIAAIAMGVLQSALIHFAKRLCKQELSKDLTARVPHLALRFLTFWVVVANGYLLMLLTMTFYVWLFVGVVTGMALGQVVFAPANPEFSACHESDVLNQPLLSRPKNS